MLCLLLHSALTSAAKLAAALAFNRCNAGVACPYQFRRCSPPRHMKTVPIEVSIELQDVGGPLQNFAPEGTTTRLKNNI